MAYSQDLANSARRHLAAADHLDDQQTKPQLRRHDVAGYLYGIAAECALKQLMRESGIYPLPVDQRRNDPFYAHFPELKTMLRDTISGRRAGELSKYAEDDSLMNEWDTDMRYAPGKDITASNVKRWRDQAHRLVDTMWVN